MEKAMPGKFNYINAVRGIAILLVIVLHVSNAVKGLPEAFSYVCGKGAFGVQLFFIASAFTLFLSYSKRIQKEGADTKHNFFIRRFFRISPMYYLAAVFYSIVCYYVPAYNDGKPLVLWKVIANIVYVNGFVPGAINYLPPGGWSVGVEMVFYCCMPFLFAKIKSFKSAMAWFVGLAVVEVVLKLLIRYILIHLSVDYHRPENWFLYFWFPNQAPVFMLGIVLFYAMQKWHINNKQRVYTAVVLNTLLLAIFAWYRRDIDAYNIIPEHVIIGIFFTINIFLLSQYTVKIFDNRVTRFFGEISFSLYLTHFIIVYVLADYLPMSANAYANFFLLLGLTLAISSVLSTFTYRFIELKGIAFGKKHLRHGNATPNQVASQQR